MTAEQLRAVIVGPLTDLAAAREYMMSTIDIPPARPDSSFCPQCGGSLRYWPARLVNNQRCVNAWHDEYDSAPNAWGTPRGMIDAEEFCIDCEHQLGGHYDNCRPEFR